MATDKQDMCTCPVHGGNAMWNPHRFIILRLLLGIVILAIVFGIGMQIGEFKGAIENGGYMGGYHQMHDRGEMGGWNMYYNQVPPTGAVPAPAAGTSATKSTTTTTTNTNK